MRDIALYYPYIHFTDDAWLKAAALYWPKIARLAPKGYRNKDSETARKLSGELDFVISIDPEPYTHGLAAEFSDFIEANSAALQSTYTVSNTIFTGEPYRPRGEDIAELLSMDFGEWMPSGASPETIATARMARQAANDGQNSAFGWVHMGRAEQRLRDKIIHSGLGMPGGTEWVVMAPKLAVVYVAALAERVAAANDLAVVTDQPDVHGILSGLDVEKMAQVLLGDHQIMPARDTEQVSAMYAAVAIRTVVPAKIADIPVEKIIEVRRKLSIEFDCFRDHLTSLADKLTEIGRVKDPTVLQARLELMAGRDLRRPAEDLEQKLRQLDLEPARAVLGIKSLELPAAVAAATSAAALPPGASEAGLVAARLISSRLDARAKRQQALADCPVGYLLGLQKQLTPGGIVERLRRILQRTAQPPAVR
jgi:hypothetical protein